LFTSINEVHGENNPKKMRCKTSTQIQGAERSEIQNEIGPNTKLIE